MIGYIDSARFDDGARKLDTLRVMLNISFLLVKPQSELSEFFPQHRNNGQQLRFIPAYERYIIHIPVMSYAYRINLPVDSIQQEVGEQLSE